MAYPNRPKRGAKSVPLVLAAAPGMTMDEVAAASTAAFDVPSADKLRGIVHPKQPCAVELRHADRGFTLPVGLYNVVDAHKGTVYRVTSTPQEDYLGLNATIELVKLVAETISALPAWKSIETPNHEALPRALPQRKAAILGRWEVETWVAELRTKQDLMTGTEEARGMGLPDGAFMTTLTIWDTELWP
jgi:hypothetical protein